MSHPLSELEARVKQNPSAAAGNIPDLLMYLENGTPQEKEVASNIYADLAEEVPSKVVSSLEKTVPVLRSGHPHVRGNLAAAFAYVAIAHPSTIIGMEQEGRVSPISNLERLLADEEDEKARRNAAEAIAHLANFQPGAVAGALQTRGFARLFSIDDQCRQYALATCNFVAEVAPEQVHRHLRHIRECVTAPIPPDERVTALATLVHVAALTPDVIANEPEPLFEAATDEHDEEVRSNALAVLAVLAKTYPGAVMDARTIAAKRLDEGERSERVNAAELLAELADAAPEKVKFAREILEDSRDNDSEEVVQTYAEVALVNLDGRESTVQQEIETLVDEAFPGDALSSFIEGGLQPIIQIGEMIESKQHVEDSVIGGGVGNEYRSSDQRPQDRER